MIKLFNVHKYYKTPFKKSVHAINDTTLEIPDKGIVALIGPSGVGKTTLLNVISGLDKYNSGKLVYDEIETTKYNSKIIDNIRLENFGFIFQNYYLMKDKSVYENVSLPLSVFNLTEKEKKERVNYVLKSLGILKYSNKLVRNLSGGEQQRVSIARALVTSPKVIFADEPTGSLDETNTFNVLNILKKISKDCLVFIATHEKDLISYYADTVIELDKGSVINQVVLENKLDSYVATDQNIYLKDLDELDTLNGNNVLIKQYSDNSKSNLVNIKIVINNNRIYLEASEDVIIVDSKSEVKLIDNNRYNVKDFVDKDFDYHLDKIDKSKIKMDKKSAFAKSFNIFTHVNFYKVLSRIIIFLVSFILLLLMNQIVSLEKKDLTYDLFDSKGKVTFNLARVDISVSDGMLVRYRGEIIEDLLTNHNLDLLLSSHENLGFNYDGFYQFETKSYVISKYDFSSLNYLDQSKIVYGRMPEVWNEIVVDKYVLNRFLNDSYLKEVVNSYEYFVGKELVGASGMKYKICGICETGNITIYGSRFLNFYSNRLKVMPYSEFVKIYPDYALKPLEENQCFHSAGLTNEYGFMTVDIYNSNSLCDLVIRDEDINYLFINYARNHSYISIETDGGEEALNKVYELLKEYEDKYDNRIIIEYNYPYEKEYNDATSQARKLVNIFTIISVVIVILTIFLVSYSSQKSLTEQIIEIAILKMIGQPKKYLYKVYLLGSLIENTVVLLLSFIVTILSFVVVSAIPISSFDYLLSFTHILLLFGLMFLIINIISFIPIIILLNKTPVSIFNTYQRKIES